nr:MAG: hypothetical protein AM325_10105 [Candidatus Thorarchaeota archaeon SMTZ1-45]
MPSAPPEPSLEESEILDEAEELASLEDSALDELPPEVPSLIEPEVLPPVDEDLSWEESSMQSAEEKPIEEDIPFIEESSIEESSETMTDSPVEEPAIPEGKSTDLSWEEGVEDIKVGMPFKEIEPPRVYDEEIPVTTEEALEHLFPEGAPKEIREETKQAVEHLFPEGRGTTTKTFIDVVVGKPSKVGLKGPLQELETPACPNCGVALSSDDFEYPDYVFEAMGKARIEHGEHLLDENEHERAIESFEIAKMLFEKARNEKGVAESTKRVDVGYDSMAKFHFDQGENHMKVNEYEWAIVQFRKARELYMFSTDAKKRARCSEKVREAYIEWGKDLENQGDQLSKQGSSRDALAKYQEAAAKFREGGDSKKLRGLEKKIRKA